MSALSIKNVRKVFGHAPEDMVGRALADFAHPAC